MRALAYYTILITVISVLFFLVRFIMTEPRAPMSPQDNFPPELTATVTAAVETTPVPVGVPPSPFTTLTAELGQVYGVEPRQLDCIQFKESSYNPQAKNKHSTATGLSQFTESTWREFREAMGADPDPELRQDPREATATLAWAIAHGKGRHWQVYEDCR